MTKTEREIQEVRETLVTHFERIEGARADLELVREGADKTDEAIDKLKDSLSAVQSQVAVLQAGFADLAKRWDDSDRRRWTVYGVMLAAVLTFFANLVLLFLKR
jgi:uncharacterized coiled-coil DUF342 family protein